MQELRKYVRYQVKQPGRLKLEQASRECSCQVKDISYKGAKIALNAKLPENTALRINLRLSEDCSIDAEVWIAWHKVFNGVNHYGIYFDKIRDMDKNKIHSFLNKYCYNEMREKWWPEETGFAKGGNDMNDHRIFERFPVDIAARYLNPDTGKEGLAKIQDVSAKGLGLTASEELRLHAALEIWLEMKNKRESLYTRGRVVWKKSEGIDSYRLGVELEKADLMGISRIFRS
ncbi:MAG: PilZ domain-containing protein [Candidatus Omnitrophota bacterium]